MQHPRRYGATSTPPSLSSLQPAATHNASEAAAPTPPDEPWRKKILFAGMRQAGKTSIQEVVFNSLPPKDTFYLETTSSIRKMDIDSIVALQFWDCPANVLANFDSLGVPLTHFQSIVFVIDVQDDYHMPIAHLVHLIATVAEVNPTVSMNIFVHKSEALSDEFKVENFRYIQSRILDELLDHPASALLENIPLNFHITSVYDHTIYEAVSRVVQRLVPQLATLENLMNTLVSNSGIAKAFLFDITALIYVATDASPVDNASFELCCDYVQMLTSFSNLYKNLKPPPPPEPSTPSSSSRKGRSRSVVSPKPESEPAKPPPVPTEADNPDSPATTTSTTTTEPPKPKAPRRPADGPKDSSSSSPSHSLIATEKAQKSSPPNSDVSGSQRTAKLDVNETGTTTKKKTSTSTNGSGSVTQSKTLERLLPTGDQEPKRWASSSAKLTPESTLAYWQIDETLSLVCLIRSETFEKHRGLIEYNVTFFRGAVQKIAQLEHSKRYW